MMDYKTTYRISQMAGELSQSYMKILIESDEKYWMEKYWKKLIDEFPSEYFLFEKIQTFEESKILFKTKFRNLDWGPCKRQNPIEEVSEIFIKNLSEEAQLCNWATETINKPRN